MGNQVTIRPGEMFSREIEHDAAHDYKPNGAARAPVPEWLTIADHVMDRLPAVAAKLGPVAKLGPSGGHIIALWIVLAAGIVGGVMHVLGDGTLRAKVDRSEAKIERTECNVDWLVERAMAEDRGDPPPTFSPLGCRTP